LSCLEYTQIPSIFTPIEKATGIFSKIIAAKEKYLSGVDNLYWQNPQACGCVAHAIMQKNFFKHKYTYVIPHFNDLENEFQNSEPGIFEFCIESCKIKNKNNDLLNFPGHAFVIIKEKKDNGKWEYTVFQSFIGKYTLIEFILIKKDKFTFKEYSELKRTILDNFEVIMKNKGAFSDELIDSVKKIADVDISHMRDYSPINSHLDCSIRRTTNKRRDFNLASFSINLFGTKILINITQ